MFIEEIILEGFKSYATRTVISGWDPQFNAITGLNGSGKSNILDAICFVLGIDNLRQVRATSMQDLIYKRGQSGITKASVTLVFNNSDPNQSPIGYGDSPKITVTRQIVVGGKHKYLVNGHNATSKAVENLFQSVQLNVNNPHFLIMQGQITKVLNMRPPEILALIEETAGTRMFEDRRGKALNTIEKKDKKVEEIEALLVEVIEPKLTTLRCERTEFLEFKRAEVEIDRLRKFLIAYEFFTRSEALGQWQVQGEALEASQVSFAQEEQELKGSLKHLEEKIRQLIKEKLACKSGPNGDQLKGLEGQVKEKTREVTRLTTQLELHQGQLNDIQKDLSKIKKSEGRDADGLQRQQQKLREAEGKLQEAREIERKAAESVTQTEDLLQSLETGLAVDGSDGRVSGYGKLLQELKERLSACTLAHKGAQLKLEGAEEELKTLAPQYERATIEAQGMMKKLAQLRAEIEGGRKGGVNGLEQGVADGAKLSNLLEERRRIEGEISEHRDSAERTQGRVSHLQFRYSDPHPGFRRDRVKGLIAQLITLQPEVAARYGTALEVAAGGKLYNVVVEDDDVARDLLDRGKLTKRVTIIPLNKIVPKTLGEGSLRKAESLAPGRVHSALQLVAPTSEDVAAAIKFVFGGTLICEDAKSAQLVAFDPVVGCRSAVTVEGDVYDPNGTLTGGSRAANSSGVLEALLQYNTAQHRLGVLSSRLEGLNVEISRLQEALDARVELEEKVSLLEHEEMMLRRQFEQNAHGRLIARKEHLESERLQLEKSLKEFRGERDELEASISRIQRESEDFAANRSDMLKNLQGQLKTARCQHQEEVKRLQAVETEFQRMESEVQTAIEQMQRKALQSSELMERQSEISKENHLLSQSLEESKMALEAVEGELLAELANLARFDQELSALEAEQTLGARKAEKLALLRAKIEADLKKIRDACDELNKQLNDSVKKYPWIEDSFKNFGVKGGHFDFEGTSVKVLESSVKELEDRQNALRRNINTNVMDMIDRLETKDVALKSMLATVHRDKSKISKTIETLDDFKREALERTWRQVNDDFGSIFAHLLPGSFSRLAPADGAPQITGEGLEIQVSLGGVWKESLTELSGGQRSLTALALILALLQYKPAPMYILDEVDAALDLSHTQNIGSLLRQRFRGSQFIVVSLKEGMFSNANVLFRTRFRDGVSSIDRFENKTAAVAEVGGAKKKRTIQKKSLLAASNENEAMAN